MAAIQARCKPDHRVAGPADAGAPGIAQPQRAHHAAHGGGGQVVAGSRARTRGLWQALTVWVAERPGQRRCAPARRPGHRAGPGSTESQVARRCEHRRPACPGALAAGDALWLLIQRCRPGRPHHGQREQAHRAGPCRRRPGSGQGARGRGQAQRKDGTARWAAGLRGASCHAQAHGPPQRHRRQAAGQRPAQALSLLPQPDPAHEQGRPAREGQRGHLPARSGRGPQTRS